MDRIFPPSGYTVSLRDCFYLYAAESIPTAPASVCLSRGKADPYFGWDTTKKTPQYRAISPSASFPRTYIYSYI